LGTPPESVEHYIDDSLARADLSARQRQAVKAELMRTLHDIRFLRMLTEEARARGPWSQAAVAPSDEGRPL
jgi:hypothetical protein